MIVEELVPVPGELELLNWDKARALTSADKAAGDALLEGGYQLANAGLGWSDMHPANYYLKKVNGKWRMGILDPDMIAPYDKMNPRVAKMASFKEFKCFEHCGSLANSRGRVRELTRLRENWAQSTYGTSADRLTEVQLREWDGSHELWGYIADHPGPHFPDAFTAMEKTMELNGFFWTDPNSGRRIGTLVDPGLPLDKAKWKPKFPEMFMGAPFDPIDPIDATTAKGFWNP
jgi:hypothetical protein